MRIKVWGARGSVPAPGPDMNRYGGNTSCVQVTFRDGSQLILDAGTGIRTLGLELADAPRVGILLTHLHLDHIQGLMFFPPCFRSDAEITIWGPSSPEASLEDRVARYISAPLSPVEVRELPCSVAFRDAPATEWRIGDVLIRAEATGTDTYEINRNLVLTDGARADSVPNLEIETGEVVGAGHASATARFDDEQLFYLMSRGIEAEQARRLVVRGFFAELVGRVPVPELRERLEAAIEERLGKVGA